MQMVFERTSGSMACIYYRQVRSYRIGYTFGTASIIRGKCGRGVSLPTLVRLWEGQRFFSNFCS